MKNKEKSNYVQNKGKLIYKSKAPKNVLILIIFGVFDIIFIYLFFEGLYLLIQSLISLSFPEYILDLIGMVISGFISSIFTYVVVLAFLSHLFIYEKGIKIRKSSLFPLKFKKFFFCFEKIGKVDIVIDNLKKGQYTKNLLYAQLTDGRSFLLLKSKIEDLEEVKNLILKQKRKYFFRNS